jgi:DNA-binding NarL/FixJ family response regulator
VTKLRIFLADDHEMIREGLKLIINAQPDMECCGEAADGRAALEHTCEMLPDMVVMDISMPKLNGLQATKKIKEVCPQVKVIVLTRHADDGYLQQLLKAGVSGYVLKQSASTELVHALRAVAAGNLFLDPVIAQKVVGSYVGKSLNKGAASPHELSDREREVLRMIAWGYSNKEIASRFDLSVKTVEAHKANAMKKLDMKSRIDIVRYALLQGWLQDT